MQLVEWKPARPHFRATCLEVGDDRESKWASASDRAKKQGAQITRVLADDVQFKLDIHPADRVLEVCCGSDSILSLLSHSDQKGTHHDLRDEFQHHAAVQARPHAPCRLPDDWTLPYVSDSFDKVICIAALSSLADEETAMKVVKELLRVCCAGGKVYIGNVLGMWEKPRRCLARIGFREKWIEHSLTLASPLWQLRHRCRLEKGSLLNLRRSVFRKTLKNLPCEVQFNSPISSSDEQRCFDVCITKCSPGSRNPPARLALHKPLHALSLQKYTSFEALLPFRNEWNELVEKTGADLFASFDWCATWWKHFHYDRRPEFFLARHEGRLVGCLPFFRETIGYGPWRIHVVRLAGSCDAGTRCDLAIEREFISEVMPEALHRLEQSGPWDVIHIGDLPGDYAHGRILAQTLRDAAGKARVVYRTGYYSNSVFDIPETYEQYLMRLSQNERSSIRRTERRLAEEHNGIIENVSPEELDAAFDEFFQQHEGWWARSGRLGYFRDWPGSMDFHRDFSRVQARQGRLHLLRLSAGGRTIGFHYCHRFGRRIHWFSGSRSTDSHWDAYSPGRQLHCAIVRQAVEHGVSQIDGMNGYFEYKKRWGARYNQLQNITIFSQDALSRLAVRDFRAASRLHYFCNRIWYWHAAPWLRRHFPNLAEGWLQKGQTQKFVRTRFMEYASAEQADDAVCYPAA